jgi:hypothetical protein
MFGSGRCSGQVARGRRRVSEHAHGPVSATVRAGESTRLPAVLWTAVFVHQYPSVECGFGLVSFTWIQAARPAALAAAWPAAAATAATPEPVALPPTAAPGVDNVVG